MFHFLIKEDDIKKYQKLVNSAVSGYMILATFSQEGPDKCSGLEIEKYSESKMKALFAANFDTIKCMTEDHVTPFASTQNFIFCSFKKRKA